MNDLSNKALLWITIGTILVSMVIGGLITFKFEKIFSGNDPIVQPDTVVVVDTLQAEPTIVYTPATIESIPYPVIAGADTVYVTAAAAVLDTTFTEGHLKVAYWPYTQWFKAFWEPYPRQIEYRDVYHTVTVNKEVCSKATRLMWEAGYSIKDNLYIGISVIHRKNGITYSHSKNEWRLGYVRQLWGTDLFGGL